jgi:lipopolysaccharide biosynthesis protein
MLPARARAVLEDADFAHVYQVVMRAVPATRDPASPGYHLPACKPARADGLQFVAFYLPQFHPIPENDAWWGKGFTEWTNTSRAEKLFPDHYQPHEPADFGYYDLRVRAVQHEQIAYARAHGIDAFCFHYYWFGGHRLLQQPIEDFLADQAAEIQFCLCWANESWTRRWDASAQDVLIAQDYSPAHDIAFMESLLPYFRDRRYLRVHGAPLLVVYRPQQLPDPAATVRRWRQFCRANGVGEIHLVAALTHNNTEFESFGFDAGVEFPPHNLATPNLRDAVGAARPLTGYVTPYGDIAQAALARDHAHRPVYRGVIPSWDNTARLGDAALVVLDGTPENYERWLAEAAHRAVAERAPGERLVFINAWNEWAEGCHLEPDRRHGMQFLEATRRVKQGESRLDPVFPPVVLPQPEPDPVAVAPEPEPVVIAPPPPPPEIRVETVSLGLRTELGMWGVRRLGRHPFVYRVGRAFYRLALKPLA